MWISRKRFEALEDRVKQLEKSNSLLLSQTHGVLWDWEERVPLCDIVWAILKFLKLKPVIREAAARSGDVERLARGEDYPQYPQIPQPQPSRSK